MEQYYVNKRAHAKNRHEVHRAGCAFLPFEKNRYCLGVFNNCFEALQEAKKFYPRSGCCFFCSRKNPQG